MRIVFFGSGAFGLPTLAALAARHEVSLVVSQPDRPAGRGRSLTPTPIAGWAAEQGIAVRKPEDVNRSEEIAAIHAVGAQAFVVIAFGQKLAPPLLSGQFAINLHASLLPAYRGAAPINWAMIDGCAETGVSVISLAERMDAGLVYERVATPIDPLENAGELHDRLAALGPAAVLAVLERLDRGGPSAVGGERQDEARVSKARKLRKEDGWLDLATLDAPAARARIHGLTPWPGCDVLLGGQKLRLLRVREVAAGGEPGTVTAARTIACKRGGLELLSLQPEGGRPMSLDAYRNGRPFEPGMPVTALGRDGATP